MPTSDPPDLATYSEIPRMGRRSSRLGARQRKAIWPVFASVRESLAKSRLITAASLFLLSLAGRGHWADPSGSTAKKSPRITDFDTSAPLISYQGVGVRVPQPAPAAYRTLSRMWRRAWAAVREKLPRSVMRAQR